MNDKICWQKQKNVEIRSQAATIITINTSAHVSDQRWFPKKKKKKFGRLLFYSQAFWLAALCRVTAQRGLLVAKRYNNKKKMFEKTLKIVVDILLCSCTAFLWTSWEEQQLQYYNVLRAKTKGKIPSFFGRFILFHQNKCSRENRLLFRWKWLRPFWWISFCQLVQFLKHFELLMPCRSYNLLLCYLSFECPSLLSLRLPVPRGRGEWPVWPASSSTTNQLVTLLPFVVVSFLLTFSWFPQSQSSPPACTSWLLLSGSSCYSLTDSHCFGLQTSRRSCGSHQSNRDSHRPVVIWLSIRRFSSNFFLILFCKDCAAGRDVWHHVFTASLNQIKYDLVWRCG